MPLERGYRRQEGHLALFGITFVVLSHVHSLPIFFFNNLKPRKEIQLLVDTKHSLLIIGHFYLPVACFLNNFRGALVAQ